VRQIGPPDPAQLRRLLDLPAHGRLLDAGGGTGRVSAQLRPLERYVSIEALPSAAHADGSAMKGSS